MRNDLTGKRFGRLVVLRFYDKNKHRSKTWECLCDCGNIKIITTGYLTSGDTQSCGCLKLDTTRQTGNNNVKLDLKTKLTHRKMVEYKSRAKDKGLPFSLTTEEFYNLMYTQCHYCGVNYETSSNEQKVYRYGEAHSIKYNGIDRIDSNRGYEIGNVVSCCKICNHAKMDLKQEDFYTWIKTAYTNILKLTENTSL